MSPGVDFAAVVTVIGGVGLLNAKRFVLALKDQSLALRNLPKVQG